ncbi:Membrane protein HPP family [Balamuthia mandrillaris]
MAQEGAVVEAEAEEPEESRAAAEQKEEEEEEEDEGLEMMEMGGIRAHNSGSNDEDGGEIVQLPGGAMERVLPGAEEQGTKNVEGKTRRAWNRVTDRFRECSAALFPSPKNYDYRLEYPLPFLVKMKGKNGLIAGPQLPLSVWTMAWSFLGAFCGILIIAVLERYFFTDQDLGFFLLSYCASAALLYGAPASPLAQPRNVIGGHTLSAFIGVVLNQAVTSEDSRMVIGAISVALAIVNMQMTNTLHPPAAATAIIPIVGSEAFQDEGFLFIPLAAGGAILMSIVALITNNLPRSGRYPQYWF